MIRNKTKISISLDRNSLMNAAYELEAHRKGVKEKADHLTNRLALIGLRIADAVYNSAFTEYDGKNDVIVKVEKTEKGYKVIASGQAVLFLEFGSGATLGYGHPYASGYGMGPSTWSLGPQGKGHWDNPNGWWFTNEEGESVHTMGNAPAKAMFQAEQEIIRSIKTIVEEVFGR